MVASIHIEALLQHHRVQYWKNIASPTCGEILIAINHTFHHCRHKIFVMKRSHCTYVPLLFKLSIEPPISPLLIQECPFDIHYRVPVNKGSMKKREKTSNACDK
eukprot:836129_1